MTDYSDVPVTTDEACNGTARGLFYRRVKLPLTVCINSGYWWGGVQYAFRFKDVCNEKFLRDR